jgi:hypothetical protein
MSDLSDPQDQAEALDPDVRAGRDDPFEERARHELPDPFADIDEPDLEALRAIEEAAMIGDDEDVLDDLDDLGDDGDVLDDLGDDEIARKLPVGRLIGPGGDDDLPDAEDDEADAVAWRADVDDDSDLSAEEEAVHLTDDPPYGERGDGYFDPDET